MKFTQYLIKNLIPEWIKLYINFKYLKTHLGVATKLKKLLRKAKKQKPKDVYQQLKYEVVSNQSLMKKLEQDRNEFMTVFDEEQEMIYNFTEWKYRELLIIFEKLNRQMKLMEQLADKTYEQHVIVTWNMGERVKPLLSDDAIEVRVYEKQKEDLLETAFKYYNECQQLQSYISINSEGIRKILKKYKKQELKGIRDKEIEIQYFGNVQQLQKKLKKFENKINILKQDVESLMINHFFADDPSQCRELIRKYTEKGAIRLRTIFYFGFFAGAAVMIILIILAMRFDGLLDPNSEKIFNKAFPCFRGMALFIIYYWFITLDLAGWNYFNINYKVYLGFNYHFSTVQELLQRVSVFTALFLVTFLWYCIAVEDSLGELSRAVQFIDIRYLPLICWVSAILYVFYPSKKYFNPQGRNWMYKMFYGALWGHFIKYESRYTFFTDQFTSMITSMRDFDYTLCYYKHFIFLGKEHSGECNFQRRFTAAQASIIPYFLKCIQYLTRARDKGKFLFTDEMYNFIKTSIAMSVGILGYLTRLDISWKYYWVAVACFCSCFEYYWDLKKDFMFFEKGTKYKFLRSDLGYNSPYIYYTLGVLNFFLRIAWVLTISPDMYKIIGIKNEMFVLFFGFLEMSRRLVNNFLKMEKEHINNLRSLKSIADLKFPFKENNQVEMEEIQSVYDVESISTLPRMSLKEANVLENQNSDDKNQNSDDKNQNSDGKIQNSNQQDAGPPKINVNQCDESKDSIISPTKFLQSPHYSIISRQNKKVSFLNLQIPLQEELQGLSLLSKKHNSTLIDKQFQDMKIPRNISFENYLNFKQSLRRINSFRLTQLLEQPKETQINIHDYMNIHPNLDLVEKAKKEELQMQSKQKKLKQDNKQYLKNNCILSMRSKTNIDDCIQKIMYISNSLPLKVVLYGDTGAGKTSMIKCFQKQKFSSDLNTTVAVDMLISKQTVDDVNYDIAIWDTAGQEKFRSIIKLSCRDSDSAMLCFDLSDSKSQNSLPEWVQLIKECCPEHISILLIGTKSDLKLCYSDEDLKQITQKYGFDKIYRTSSKNGSGVDNVFQEAFRVGSRGRYGRNQKTILLHDSFMLSQADQQGRVSKLRKLTKNDDDKCC